MCCRKAAGSLQQRLPLLLLFSTAALLQTALAQTLEKEYIMPVAPPSNEHRHHCKGFSQLEPLKGEWVDHHDPNYMGMTTGKPCPSFINDFDCLHPYKPDPYYDELGRRVSSRPLSHVIPLSANTTLNGGALQIDWHMKKNCTVDREGQRMLLEVLRHKLGRLLAFCGIKLCNGQGLVRHCKFCTIPCQSTTRAPPFRRHV
jgi:hypothetical protein